MTLKSKRKKILRLKNLQKKLRIQKLFVKQKQKKNKMKKLLNQQKKKMKSQKRKNLLKQNKFFKRNPIN